MGKPVQQTEKAYFDSDHKSPNHDEMVLWTRNLIKTEMLAFWMKSPNFVEAQKRDPRYRDIIEMEKPIMAGNYIVGYLDISVLLEYNFLLDRYLTKFKAIFEIKTQWPSLGDLLRQINKYKEYISPTQTYLVAPPPKNSTIIDTLIDEHIIFIEYPLKLQPETRKTGDLSEWASQKGRQS